MFDEALLRLFGEHPGCVLVPLVAWLVTGEWPAHQLRWDVSFPEAGWSRLPGI
ncbi:MAG: hypothetical protein ACLP3C_36235 [Mycobacterium sp.]|uniref:hypothetical protein n=1 Tax=Mycobacterium sp. TaxID=1785 RepID=UPI003F9529A9